jgi:ATP-dependent DNA helicase RecG
MEIQYVKGVGSSFAKKLEKLSLTTTKDTLTFFPTSYQDRRNIKKIHQLIPNQDVFVLGKIFSITEAKKGNYHIINVILKDETAEIKAIWFNQAYLKKFFKKNQELFLVGKIEIDDISRKKTIKVSDHEFVNEDNINRIIPIYSLTKGVYQRQLRIIVEKALKYELAKLIDPFSDNLREKYNLLKLSHAIWFYHYPRDKEVFLMAKRRLVFEDIFYLQLALIIHRNKIKQKEVGIHFLKKEKLVDKYFSSLPYKLTNAQKKVIKEIECDMCSVEPMNRMVQGDVGAGKTEVAMFAILLAVDNGYQVAIMAPTEILAYQHYKKMIKYLTPLGIRVELFTGSIAAKKKIRNQYLLSADSIQVAVGTHALIQDKIEFNNLGLVVIDEQHRFGVLQRSALRKKSKKGVADLLVITATPIPRTLTLTLYGDLDKSILDEMPPGRTPIQTEWIKKITTTLLAKVKLEISRGNQVYWVFPLVEESEKIDLQAATEGAEKIKKEIFPSFRIGLLHGKMKQSDKDRIMQDFRDKKIDILVATTVIEVGVDVPDATVMIIEHAERFGLSQLHQLRGRIGRSTKASFCYLISTSKTSVSQKRLGALVKTTNGFDLAEVDLEIRGPGDYFGAKQSGLPTMHIANLIKDEAMILEARKIAKEIASHSKETEYLPIFEALQDKPEIYVGKEGMN